MRSGRQQLPQRRPELDAVGVERAEVVVRMRVEHFQQRIERAFVEIVQGGADGQLVDGHLGDLALAVDTVVDVHRLAVLGDAGLAADVAQCQQVVQRAAARRGVADLQAVGLVGVAARHQHRAAVRQPAIEAAAQVVELQLQRGQAGAVHVEMGAERRPGCRAGQALLAGRNPEVVVELLPADMIGGIVRVDDLAGRQAHLAVDLLVEADHQMGGGRLGTGKSLFAFFRQVQAVDMDDAAVDGRRRQPGPGQRAVTDVVDEVQTQCPGRLALFVAGLVIAAFVDRIGAAVSGRTQLQAGRTHPVRLVLADLLTGVLLVRCRLGQCHLHDQRGARAEDAPLITALDDLEVRGVVLRPLVELEVVLGLDALAQPPAAGRQGGSGQDTGDERVAKGTVHGRDGGGMSGRRGGTSGRRNESTGQRKYKV